MKSWFSKKDRLLAGTIMAGAAVAGFAGPALAQDSGDEEIVVTGSRIPQPNLQSVSPVTQVGAEEIATRGITRIEDMLNELPQTLPGQDGSVSNGASGTATVDLRGLGSNRTLVLLNGRRMTAGDPAAGSGYAPDLNLIPSALVERIEVLTGGASAVYGADAVAGVVNFIMQDDFEGVRLDAGYSFYQTDTSNDYTGGDFRNLANRASVAPRFYQVPDDNQVDGESWNVTAVFGANTEDGRGNVTAYMDYRNINAIRQGSRAFSACTFNSGGTPSVNEDGDTSSPFLDDEFNCGGSSTTFPTRIQAVSNTETIIGLVNFQGVTEIGPGRQVGAGGAIVPGAALPFNFAPDNYFQRPDERYSGGAFARYELNPHVELYAETMFMDDRSVAQIAPSGLFRGSGLGTLNGFYAVNCDNPFLSAAEVAFMCDADTLVDLYDPGDPDADGDLILDRDEAINTVMAAGDDPATAGCNEATNAGDCVGALVDATVGIQQNCPDPDGVTPGNQAICVVSLAHRNVNGSPRQSDLRHTHYRFVLGARGEITDGWNYDVSGVYHTMLYQQNYLNEVSLSRVNRALINIGGQCGVNVDADPANDDVGCVPLDIFDDAGPTAGQLAYVVTPGFLAGSTRTSMFSAAVTGDLGTMGITSPWAEDGIGVAFGVEARHEELELRADTLFCPSTILGTVSDLLGQGATTCPVDGAYSVVDLFGEANVPIVQNQPFFHSLGLELGYRFSDYSISGGSGFQTDAFKVGGHWAPTEDIRFRGAFQRSVRAPNITELFAPLGVGLAGTTDPCAGPQAPNPVLEAQCALTGVSAAQFGNIAANPAAQYNGLLGGNVNLQPETADSITLGFVFTPTFLSGFTASFDWYNIQVEDRIGPIGPDVIIQNCLASGDALSPFCLAINRAPGTGSLWIGPNGYTSDVNRNAGSYEVTGMDLNVRFNHEIGSAGELTWAYNGSYLDEYLVTPFGAPTFDCAGTYGPSCAGSIGGFGNPQAQYRHMLSTTWDTPMAGLSFTGSWRYIDEIQLHPNDAAALPAGYTFTTDLILESQNYFDLAASWDVWENVTFRGGVNNVTDEDPPLTGSFNCPSGPCNGNTWPGVYDAVGRYFFFGVTADF